MNTAHIKADFIGAAGQRTFVLLRMPTQDTVRTVRRCVLVAVPPTDEMNKTRHALTEVASRLAALGIATLLPDPYGTGDSDGEFRQADWDRWTDDLQNAARWSGELGWPVNSMLGVRLGCILGAAALRKAGSSAERSVFWQPVTDGARWLTQFLRTRVASSMMEADRKESVPQLRERLAGGETLEVGGYELGPALAAQLEHLQLDGELGSHLGALHWMEIVRDSATELTAPAQRAISAARSKGVNVATHAVVGEPFWSTVEITLVRPLIDRTVELLAEAA